MRLLLTLLLAFCLCSAQAQRLTLADLLSVTTCKDTACITAFAAPKSLCLFGGKEKDGWIWLPCDEVDKESPLDGTIPTSLGFFGYHGSNYHHYFIATRDTAYVALLTAELERLGARAGERRHEGYAYRIPDHPGVELERLEKKSISIVPKRQGDPKGPYNMPLEELPEPLAESFREPGYGSYERIPVVLWMFRAVVRK